MTNPAIDEVFLWHIPLTASGQAAESAHHTLSSDECRRADSYTFEPARIRYTVCRAEVRRRLARLIGCEPHQIKFSYGKNGKPSLLGVSTQLTFNVAHSSDFAVLAVSGGTEVGIDVERIRPIHELESLTTKIFSLAEQEALKGLSEPQKIFRFFQIWTHKEALLKAIGCGLEIEPCDVDSFSGSIGPARGNSVHEARCSLYNLQTPPGFVAALATILPVEIKAVY